MGLPHLTIDLRDAFRAGVVEPYLADHAAGRTPNPCVRCNGHVRIDAMVELADRLGAAQLATGHYARVRDGLLALAADPAKDQTYMLAALSPQTITRLRFPLGDLVKPEVRAIAAQADLPVARAPESQDLCFLAGVGKARFLERHGALRDRDGAIVDTAGRQVGRHRGHQHFTVGQRKGLGVSVPDEAGRPEPLFVVSTRGAPDDACRAARADTAHPSRGG
jgi:tRNA-specific 2-thiouridylase